MWAGGQSLTGPQATVRRRDHGLIFFFFSFSIPVGLFLLHINLSLWPDGINEKENEEKEGPTVLSSLFMMGRRVFSFMSFLYPPATHHKEKREDIRPGKRKGI